jgi:hypothetical protein
MTGASAPVGFTWDGEAMRPSSRFRQQCDRQFVVGQQYVLEERMERSSVSHRHYFASINELWHSLPERLSAEFPSPEHLRKRALIRCGYRDQRSVVCASHAEALRVAAFIRPVDSYAEVSVSGSVVVHLTAVSQNLKSMDRKTFGESKNAVLEWICELVGADPTLIQADAASARRVAA